MARRLVAGLVVLAAVLTGLLAPTSATSLAREPFVAGQTYTGTFADPSVVRVGNRYYAHSTTTAQLSLPTLVSSDLRSWTAMDEGMTQPGPWVRQSSRGDSSTFSPTWAPSVAWLPGAGWVAAYSAPWTATGKRCVAIARGSSAVGPFVDSSDVPLTCGFSGTAIDPQVFRDASGKVFLLIKSKGSPNRLVVRQLDAQARGFMPGTGWHLLLMSGGGWEGGVVENPAMIRYGRSYYLFYSANAYDTTAYATGYARCSSVYGPCTRMGRLLATNAVLAGPGGATPFVDTAGRLRLAYHAYRTSEAPYLSSAECAAQTAACPARRLYVAALAPARKGRLRLYTVP